MNDFASAYGTTVWMEAEAVAIRAYDSMGAEAIPELTRLSVGCGKASPNARVFAFASRLVEAFLAAGKEAEEKEKEQKKKKRQTKKNLVR